MQLVLNEIKKLKLGPLSLSANETVVNVQQHFPFFFFLPPISSAFTSFLASLNVSRILDGFNQYKEIFRTFRREKRCTYELVFVLVACQSDFLNELINIFSSHSRALSDNLDIVFPSESLAISHLDLFVIRIEFVTCHRYYALLGRRLFELLNPSICSIHTLSASRVVNDQGGVGVAQVHAVEDHVALLAGQVVDLEVDLCAEGLDPDWQVLLGDGNSGFLIGVDLLLEHALDEACFADRFTANNHDFKGAAHL